MEKIELNLTKNTNEASGETTQDEMTREAKLSFTSKTKALDFS